MYEYRARVVKVVDGDTVRLDVDLGCDVHVNMTVRLYGINCPELRTPEGHLAKDYVIEWLGGPLRADWNVMLYTRKDKREKYGRYLGEIYQDGRKLNEDLVINGHAERKEYR